MILRRGSAPHRCSVCDVSQITSAQPFPLVTFRIGTREGVACPECMAALSGYREKYADSPRTFLDWHFFRRNGRRLLEGETLAPVGAIEGLPPVTSDENAGADRIRAIEREEHAEQCFRHTCTRAVERIDHDLTLPEYETWVELAAASNRRGEIRFDGTQRVVIRWNGRDLRVGWNIDLKRVTTVLGFGDDLNAEPELFNDAGEARDLVAIAATGPLDTIPPDGVRSFHPAPAADTHDDRRQTTMTTNTPALAGSPFKKATLIPKRLKAFVWGGSGVGKTILALNFPAPVVIDLERGTDYYGDKFPFQRLDPPPRTVADMFSAVRWLVANEHEYRTLVIDPVTVFWEMMQDEWSDRLGVKAVKQRKLEDAEDFELQPKDWKPIKGQFREFMRLLTAVDMNVIVTAREKTKYADGQFMKSVGETFDGEKSMPYLFDVELRLFRRPDGARFVHVMKDRTGVLPKVDFPAVYAEFEKCLGSEALAKKATPAADQVGSDTPAAPANGTPAAPVMASPKPSGPPATDSQLTFLRALVQQKVGEPFETFLFDRGFADGDGKLTPLTSNEARALIEELKAAPAKAAA